MSEPRTIGVLVCDDSDSLRTLLGVVIDGRDGMTLVGEAVDGVEAIAQAELLQPDVILLDVSMPRMTGLEALPEIKRVAPAAQVVFLSGFSASLIDGGVVGSGATSYLQKGIPPDEILDAIESAAARGATATEDGPGRN